MIDKDDTGKPMISVVVPAYNEQDGIFSALCTISEVVGKATGDDYELIVVDDGSNDQTFEEVKKLHEKIPQVTGVRLSRNFGKEGALLAGLHEAKGKAVITIDADLQHPPILIQEMIDKWNNGAQIVHAVKRDRSTDKCFIRYRAVIFNNIFSKLGGVSIQNSSDFKLLDRAVVDILVGGMQERERFYRGLASWVGFRQEKIYFDVASRQVGKGKWALLSLLELALTATISFTSRPLRIVTVLGIVTLVFVFFVTAETLWSRVHGRAVSGFATIEITLLIIGSLIMISLGILGEYIAKIYQETKARPIFIIADRISISKNVENNN